MDPEVIEKLNKIVKTYGIDALLTINTYISKGLSTRQMSILEGAVNRFKVTPSKWETTVEHLLLGVGARIISTFLYREPSDDVYILALKYYMKGLPFFEIARLIKNERNEQEFYIKIKTISDRKTDEEWKVISSTRDYHQ